MEIRFLNKEEKREIRIITTIGQPWRWVCGWSSSCWLLDVDSGVDNRVQSVPQVTVSTVPTTILALITSPGCPRRCVFFLDRFRCHIRYQAIFTTSYLWKLPSTEVKSMRSSQNWVLLNYGKKSTSVSLPSRSWKLLTHFLTAKSTRRASSPSILTRSFRSRFPIHVTKISPL